MGNLSRLLFGFGAVLLCFASPARGQLHCLETENLRLLYLDVVQSYLAPHAARCFENSFRFHSKLWGYVPDGKITVLMHDISDHGNAGARNVPTNLCHVAIAPFSFAYETVPTNERMNTMMNHELVHIAAMDRASGSDNFFRKIFLGKPEPTADAPLTVLYDFLTAPRRAAPRWYHEGIAVFLETWMAGGFGRCLGPYDEMVFRTMVVDSSRFYDPVGLEAEGTKTDFHVTINSYLYGARFFSYLAYQHDPERVVEWVSRQGGTRSYFVSQFKKTFGVPLDEEWSRWIDFEKAFQQTNLDSIRQYPITPYRDISGKVLGSVSRAYYDAASRKLYAAVNYPGTYAHLAEIDVETGEVNKIRDIKGPALFFATSLAYDSASGSLFYTTDNYSWRDICVVNTRTGKSRMLLDDARVGDLVFNYADSSLWGVRHFNGITTLVRIPYPYEEWNQLYSWPYGTIIYDLDISPDGGRLSAALAEISGRQTLITMETDRLMLGDSSYTSHFDFGNSNPTGFVFSPDGRYLYGSSYYTGASNIFRFDLEADSMEALSNCETGFFRPIPYSEDSLIVFRYTSKGFIPVVIAGRVLEDVSAIKLLGQQVVNKHPIVKDWMIGSPAAINLDSLTTYKGSYRALPNMRLVSAYPVVEGYREYTSVGMRLNFASPVEFHSSDLAVSYSPSENIPSDERWHVKWGYAHLDWNLNFRYNAADFYDLFGPTKTSRKGYSLGMRYQKTLLFDEPRAMHFAVGLTGYGDLERLPDFQNVSTSYDKFYTATVNLDYENLRASLGAVDYEKGYSWELSSGNTYVNEKFFPRIQGSLNLGFPLFIGHSSLWLRTSAGYSHGDRYEPFANFFFGGFGNNWVDHQTEKRYRRYYSFPGVDLNAIGGTNFGKLLVEWSLPPLRFRRLGGPAFYCTFARLALFSTGIVTNMDNREHRRDMYNVGAQLDLRFQLLSNQRLTLSFGYAAALEEGERATDEFMVSLKIL